METEEKKIAIKYSKKRIYDDVYAFEAKSVLDEFDLNEDGTISYLKKGNKKVLHSIIDPYFLISDEKYGYGDMYSLDSLCNYYKIDNYEKMLEIFKSAMTNVIRLCIFDEKNECVRTASLVKDNVLKAPLSRAAFTDFVIDAYSYADKFLLDKGALNIIIRDMEDKYYDKALAEVKCIKKIVEEYAKNAPTEHLTVELKDVPDAPKIDSEKLLNSLIGLDDIKIKDDKLKKNLLYRNRINEMDEKNKINLESLNLNMIFTGNPGTGKTTIARIIAGILYDLGYVKNPNFIETTAQDFIGGYVGQTALKTRTLLDEHKGAVIFIDEAYVFASGGQLYADEAIAEILKEMECKETVFIFAGYKEEMKKFIDMNSGLYSRVGSIIDFKDYTLDELMDIFDRKVKVSSLLISDKAREIVKDIIKNHMNVDKFGNGRFIDQLFDAIMLNHGYNTYDSKSITTLKTIHIKDLEGVDEEIKDNGKVKKIGFKTN